MEIQDITSALDEIRSVYKEQSDALANDVKELHMGPRGLRRCEEVFAGLQFMEDRLNKLLMQYKALLPCNEANKPIYPEEVEGQGFTYTKDNVNKLRVEFDLCLHNLQKIFIRFKMSQTDLVQTWIKKHAQLECLGDNEVAEAFQREVQAEDNLEDTLVEEQPSVIHRGDQNIGPRVKVDPTDNKVVFNNVQEVPNFEEAITSSPANS